MLNVNNKTLKYGLVGLLALVLIVSGIDYTITQIKISKIPQDLRINTDKDNIIGAQVIPQGKIYDKQDPKKVIYEGEVVKYAYKTEKIEDKVNEVVEKRTKHSRTVKVAEDNEKITYQLEVISGVPQYYEDEDGEWYQADYGTTDIKTYSLETKGSVLATLFFPNKVYATTGTFFAGAGDGIVYRNVSQTWTSLRSGVQVGSDFAASSGDAFIINHSATTNEFTYMSRSVYPFDTSSLSASATITAGTFSIVDDGGSGTCAGSLDKYTTANFDISNFAGIRQSDDNSGCNQGARINFALNSTGISNVSKTGTTQFAIRSQQDFDNTTPTWSSGRSDYMGAYFSENAGTTNDPKLEIIYTVPAGNFFQMF